MKAEKEPIIALLTDFGTEDGYVGALKGRLLSLVPFARLVDVSHRIPPFNVRAGAFCLANAFPYFPAHSIFLVVVDPGVGTNRRGLVLKAGQWWFVGPDNGVFTLVWKDYPGTAFRIREERLAGPVSATFHGRDVFAPLAAKIALGQAEPFLEPTHPPESFWTDPRPLTESSWQVEVLHIDRFGNVIFNLHRSQWEAWGSPQPLKLEVGALLVQGPLATFGQVAEGQCLLNWDSSGYLQLACNRASAAQKLNLKPGQKLKLKQ